MRCAAVGLVLLVFGVAPAYSGEDDYTTTGAAVLCEFSSSLPEAMAAASEGDRNWLHELRCVYAMEGLPVIRVHPRHEDRTVPWKVRVKPNTDAGFTAWGYATAFR